MSAGAGDGRDADLRGLNSWEAAGACCELQLARCQCLGLDAALNWHVAWCWIGPCRTSAYRLLPAERGSPQTWPGLQART